MTQRTKSTSLAPYTLNLLLQGVSAVLSWRNYTNVPVLPPFAGGSPVNRDAPWPLVSIVIPARDEEARLPALLASLRALTYPNLEVVVVDDNSSDHTAEIAHAAGVRVVGGAPLPAGWTGKAFACHQGARASTGEWLLFTDADTLHAPASLSAALAYALQHNLAALSLLTGQQCDTFASKLLLPFAYAGLFAGAGEHHDTRGGNPAPLANGQHILIRRTAYEASGGHAAVRSSLIEDAALGRRLAAAGVPYRLLRGESFVQVCMYASLFELWSGFRKNAARYALDEPRRLPAVVLHTAALSVAAPLLDSAARSRNPWACVLATVGYVVGMAGLVPWYRRFGVPAAFATLYPAAAAVFGLITADSTWRMLGPGAAWKGRRYR